MDAKEFVKQYGWGEARKCIPYCLKRGDFIYYKNIGINFNNLKTLVDAWELVEKFGGLESCYEKLYMLHELTEDPEPIREAIELVEQCQ